MGQAEPPSCGFCSPSLLFLIGQDSHGNWVVREQQGRCGGLFVSRAEALRFARRENGNRPHALVMVPGVFELDLGPGALHHPVTAPAAALQRVA